MPPEKENEIEKGPLRVIECSFNIYESGWDKFGNHRKYIAGNVDSLVNGAVVQERVERGVMVGFFGHKSNPDVEAVEDPKNLASHTTTLLKFHPKSGDVEHEQAVNRTNTGRALLSLHDSGVGNFSWKGKGTRSFVGIQFKPEAERHLRMDYVYVPGMVNQPKRDVIIKESVEFDEILKRFEENGLVIEEAVEMAADWQATGILLSDIETQLQDAMVENGILMNQREEHEQFRVEQDRRKTIVEQALASTHFKFSEPAMRVLCGLSSDEADVSRFIGEMQAYANVDLSRYPGTSRKLVLQERPKPLDHNGQVF
ncbi:MAG: hypothetical protein GY866_42630, partial [Proteobacteria bacterium]|nr:hypothetical protein [Pseudomonadota bacterium]